jgi:hypothetical protein
MADVASDLKNWSTTEGSNAPLGGTIVGAGLDDNLRRIQATVRQDLASKGSDVASTATADVGAVAGFALDITGTTTITGLGTVSGGIHKVLKFEGALTLTHNATSLILPGGANITTADGDIGWFISEGSGNWRCISYMRAASEPLAFASQAQQETGSSLVVAVPPGRQHFHQSAAKVWGYVTVSGGTPTLVTSYNVTSIADTDVGRLSVTIATDLSSGDYAVCPGVVRATTAFSSSAAHAAGSFEVWSSVASGTTADPESYSFAVFGDLP